MNNINQKHHPKTSVSTLVLTLALSVSGAAMAKPNAVDRDVQQKFEAAYLSECDSMAADQNGTITPHIYNLTFRHDYNNAPLSTYTLYEFPCYVGAYNQSSVYFRADEYGEILQVHFAFPEYEVTYKDDLDEVLDTIIQTGFSTYHALTNADFDEQTQTLNSHSAWRGLGDASSQGKWQFVRGQFILQAYDIDPTYDGEINPIRIYQDGATVPYSLKE